MGEESSGGLSQADLLRSLESEIKQGRHAEGALLPSEEEAAARFGVSRYAVAKCYAELARRGYVRRIKRRGTVVTYNAATMPIHKVGLIMVSDVPAYHLFQKGVEQVLGERGAGVRVRYNYNHEPTNEAALKDALEHDVEGLIVAPPQPGSHEPYRKLMSEGFPIVLVMASDPEVHSVFPNDHAAGVLIGDHLGEMGFRRPAVVSDESDYAKLRVYGLREGMARHGMKLADDRVLRIYYATEKGELLADLGRAQAEALLAMKPRPDCVLAVNDAVAIAVYYWLLKMGVRVPEDMAVAGVDGLGPRIHPFQLTTVDIGLERIGREAAGILMELIQGPRTDVIQRQIEPALVVSASTSPAAPARRVIF